MTWLARALGDSVMAQRFAQWMADRMGTSLGQMTPEDREVVMRYAEDCVRGSRTVLADARQRREWERQQEQGEQYESQ